ncbi:hemoglobin subunit beta-like [Hypanus sabinus]|uniref:hemoglobin subunit beta-like n=1 Tax=Hypanus sabinus TaxID=79690 RepID=UPI0028C48844|nr:hemoglobin subunit beta-like [Hypanus sabinus]
MVKLTEDQEQYITGVWNEVEHRQITAKALERVFVVYPWTTRLFSKLQGRFSASEDGVQQHAEKVQKALSKAISDLKKVESNFHALSAKHQEIGVDTQNFKLLGQTFIVELALHYKKAFRPKEHAAAYKFFRLVAEALASNYH